MSHATNTYVYGVLRADAAPRVELSGVGDPPGPVHAVSSGRLTALVSDLPAHSLSARRSDLRRHMDVVRQAAESSTIVPLRFGTVMPHEEAVVTDLLEGRREELERLLRELDGRVELTLKGVYPETVFAEILSERREIARLRDRVANTPPDAAYYDSIRLGELIAGALEERRERDTLVARDRLTPKAEAVSEGALTHERGVFNLAFLVPRDRLESFDDAAAALAADYGGRIEFRYHGPLPPYSFVALEERTAWG
jgi:hypothetical protein